MSSSPVFSFAVAGAGVIVALGAAWAGPGREWRFDATLDGRPIGEHVFRVTELHDVTEVDSRASFDVRFLGFSVYTYEHRAIERWKDGCLAELDARTDDNGKIEIVQGRSGTDGFEITRNGSTATLAPCTMTFAYWNPAIRAQRQLLNPQTGDYLDVQVDDRGPTTLEGQKANRWRISGKDVEIDVFYDTADDHWLALESKTSGDRLISYRLPTKP